MSRPHLPIVCAFILLISVQVACSNGPTTPGNEPWEEPQVPRSQSAIQAHHCLGYYSLVVDTDSYEAEVLPARTGERHFNVTGILNTTMGVTAVIEPDESDPPAGLFGLDITLTHPFGTKPQLAGFDVKGILMTPGSLAIGPLLFADVGETRLENADGYTRWWNPAEFTEPGLLGYTDGTLANATPVELTATVNPYKYFADILDAEDPMSLVYNEPLENDRGRGVFTAGSSNTRLYKIRFPMAPGPQIIFGYAIDASWAAPDPKPPSQIPDDFPIEANQPEAYNLVVQPTANSLYYNSAWARGGGVLRLQVNVHDWQGQDTGNIADEVEVVRVFSPDLFSGGETAYFLNESTTKARYTASIWETTEPVRAGQVLVAVRAGSKEGPTYDQGLGAPAPTSEVSAWQVIEVEVTDPQCAADTNNAYTEAVSIGLSDHATDTLCVAADQEDWYRIEVPGGFEASGWITFTHGAGTQDLALTDSEGNLLVCALNNDRRSQMTITETWPLTAGVYYIRCRMTTDYGAVLYLLDVDLELTDVRPMNPVDVTPTHLDLDAFWLCPESPHYAYVAGYAGWWAFDTSYYPHMMSRTRNPLKATPACYPPYMYYWEDWIDDPAGIDLIDYSSKVLPILHEDVLVFPNKVEFMTMNSEHLYVAVDSGTNTWMHIYDYATDPANPVELNVFEAPHNQKRLALFDPEGPDTTLVTMNNDTLRLFDVEDPTSVTQKDTVLLLSGINTALDVNGQYVARIHYDGVSQSYLEVSKYDPVGGLTYWGAIAIPGVPETVAIQGTYAYLPGTGPSIIVVDYTTQSSFSFSWETQAVSGIRYLDTAESKLFAVLDGAGIATYDINSPAMALELFRKQCLNNPLEGVVKDDYLYFIERSGLYGALIAINITQPLSPLFRGEYLLDERPVCMAQYGALLAIGADNNTLYVFNISDPLNCELVFTDTCVSYINSIGMSGYAIYAALGNAKMAVYDIMAYPTITPMPDEDLPNFDTPGDAVVYGPDMYIARLGTNMFWWFNISDPIDPYFSGGSIGVPDMGNLHEMTRQWDYMYICYDDGLAVYELTSPAGIENTLELPQAPNYRHLCLGGQFAYLSDNTHSPVVVGIWDPHNTEILGEPFGDHPGFDNRGLIAHDGYLYILHRNIGLRVFDLY